MLNLPMSRVLEFLDDRKPSTPCLVVDVDVVRRNVTQLRTAFPGAHLRYAVKANPAAEIIRLLRDDAVEFDVASIGEIDRCVDNGVPPAAVHYGNPMKKTRDIVAAAACGVDSFVVDSEDELRRIADNAPGVGVSCRILVDAPASQTPFGRKFGCTTSEAVRLSVLAAELGLRVDGPCFHVGSQQLDGTAWQIGIENAAEVVAALAEHRITVRQLNIGGGFPIDYAEPAPPLTHYATVVHEAMARHFGSRPPELVLEVGRAVVGSAGLIRAEVIGVRHAVDGTRWVFLDIGRYNGLAETENEYIHYRIATGRDGPRAPVVLAGPTCDGDDVIYQHTKYALPVSLRAGDHVDLFDTGAYTASYSSVCFNGIPPLDVHMIDGAE